MDDKIKNSLFFLCIFTLCINDISKPFLIGIVGGSILGSKLCVYPILVSIIYTLYCQYKYKDVFVSYNKFKKFLGIYISVNFISLFIGLYNYQYYDFILNDTVNQTDKILKLFDYIGIEISERFGTLLLIYINPIRRILLEIIYTFCVSYIFFCWYYNKYKVALRIILKAIIASLIIVIVYSGIEIFYLAGNECAKNILIAITPYFHTVEDGGEWWPPLLWYAQLRSVFAEPSYFGIYVAFILPYIWLMVFKSNFSKRYEYLNIAIVIIVSFMLFLTKARTGFMLHIGELLVLISLLMYTGKKYYLKKSMLIALCSLIAFVGSNLFIGQYMMPKSESVTISESINNYIDSNAVSLVNADRRSNRARYSVMLADLKVGLENPLMGVGTGLRTAYIVDAFTETALNNKEVSNWVHLVKQNGILKSGIPKLGEYTSRFCETGILGLFVFLFPPVYLIFNMMRKLKKITEDAQVTYIMFLTSFAGILASGIGDTINIVYCYWILLGLGYTMCFSNQEEADNKRT